MGGDRIWKKIGKVEHFVPDLPVLRTPISETLTEHTQCPLLGANIQGRRRDAHVRRVQPRICANLVRALMQLKPLHRT